MITAAIVGGSGFIGGELLRLLLGHPDVRVAAVTSRSFAGRAVHLPHPHLRGLTDLRFCELAEVGKVDVLLLATPSGVAATVLGDLVDRCDLVIDLSPDFRLHDEAAYLRYYGPHPAWQLTSGFVTGLPELCREALRRADRIAVPGCMATAAVLALYPLSSRGLLAGDVSVTALTGSSGGGSAPSRANLHAIRSGNMRVYAPLGHRHEAEITQATGLPAYMTAIGVEAVRGVQVVCHAAAAPAVAAKDVREAYRKQYAGEPFTRVLRQRRGVHPRPEPKVLAGSNFCDVAVEMDERTGHLVAFAALDNLVKGAAGAAVQCLNIRMGQPEDRGLGFSGLHPL